MGAVTFDERVGLSHTTGEITHHISPDVDGERDRLFQGLEATGQLAAVDREEDFHKVRAGPQRRRRSVAHRWAAAGRRHRPALRTIRMKNNRNPPARSIQRGRASPVVRHLCPKEHQETCGRRAAFAGYAACIDGNMLETSGVKPLELR